MGVHGGRGVVGEDERGHLLLCGYHWNRVICLQTTITISDNLASLQ